MNPLTFDLGSRFHAKTVTTAELPGMFFFDRSFKLFGGDNIILKYILVGQFKEPKLCDLSNAIVLSSQYYSQTQFPLYNLEWCAQFFF